MNINANRITRTAVAAGLHSLGLLLVACSGKASPAQAKACQNGISQTYAELERAKADGFGEAVAITKAASLLSAAKIQQQFEKYPNCIDKTERARYYIGQARGSA